MGRPKVPDSERRVTLQAYVKRRTADAVKRAAAMRAQSIASLVDQICEEWIARQEEVPGEAPNDG